MNSEKVKTLIEIYSRVYPIIEMIPKPDNDLMYVENGVTEENNVKFEKLKTELDNTKSIINKFDLSDDKVILDFRDRVKIYNRALRRQINQPFVSNAWLKFYEIFHDFNFDQHFLHYFPDDEMVTAFHNAELPGSTILASKAFFKKKLPNKEYLWYASSLWPTNENSALGDVYQLYDKNKENWLMDPKHNNGDMSNVDNVLDIAKKSGKVKIYTSDAGIDTSSDYNNQEMLTLSIHLGCALAGLLSLEKGGLMVLKQYTRFHPLSWSLIILYSSLFDKFYLTKPLSSSNMNSEVYLVGIGYNGMSDNIKNILIEKLRKKTFTSVFNMNEANRKLYEDSYKHISIFTEAMNELQIKSIDSFYSLIDNYKSDNNFKTLLNARLRTIGDKLRKDWLKTYSVVQERKRQQKKRYNRRR